MSFWIVAGIMTALTLSLIISPLGKNHKTLLIILIIGIPALSLGLYLATGNPQFTQ